MYPGYLIIGNQDPLGHPGDFTEILNNPRAYAYAEWGGICWLQDCGACDPTTTIIPGSPYVNPVVDPAPWYDVDNPDSSGFFGVIGLDVVGENNSTRQAEVSMGLSGIGSIGPTYFGPRTMVVRALAIAENDCSLQYGLQWLRQHYKAQHNACGGDTMTFFDCCPCVCADDQTNPDCWAETYGGLAGDPQCIGTAWWPSTYGELITGPDPEDPDWCMWIEINREINSGPPKWSCCTETCALPYLRQFYQVRVTEGPNILQSPALNNAGAVAEIEFTIVAADPAIYGHVLRGGGLQATGAQFYTDEAPPAPWVNPYRPSEEPVPDFVPELWVRDEFPVSRLSETILSGIEPRLRVRASERTGPVRLGLWAGDTRVAGYTIPFVAQNSSVVVYGSKAYYSTPDGYEPLSAFVKDWDGKWPRSVELPHGDYRVTVDQRPEDLVKVYVDVSLAPVGAG